MITLFKDIAATVANKFIYHKTLFQHNNIYDEFLSRYSPMKVRSCHIRWNILFYHTTQLQNSVWFIFPSSNPINVTALGCGCFTYVPFDVSLDTFTKGFPCFRTYMSHWMTYLYLYQTKPTCNGDLVSLYKHKPLKKKLHHLSNNYIPPQVTTCSVV